MAKKLEREARQDKMDETDGTIMCLGAFVTMVLFFIISFVVVKLYDCKPSMPSISVESMSVTVVGIASDSQVKANLEVVFGPVENKNMNNTIIYNHLNAMAFHLDKLGVHNYHPLYSNKKLVENITVASSLEQQGGDKTTTVVVRMKDLTVDVDEYEQRIYGRYGVSYFMFELVGFIKLKDGSSCSQNTSGMRAQSQVLKVVFPLFQWNQTNKFDFQPPKTCLVYGEWGVTGSENKCSGDWLRTRLQLHECRFD